MTCYITLYLRDEKFQEAQVELMDYNYEECYTDEERFMVFEATADIRKKTVDEACSELRTMYIRQILKCQYQYLFVLRMESKMNFIPLTEELYG